MHSDRLSRKIGSPCFEIDQSNSRTLGFCPALVKNMGGLDIRLEWKVGGFGCQADLSLNTDSLTVSQARNNLFDSVSFSLQLDFQLHKGGYLVALSHYCISGD